MAEAPPDAQHFLECDNCDVRPAKHHCSDCDGDLCDDCKDKHLHKKISKNHTIIPISLSRKQKQKVNYGLCTVHYGQKYEFYCNDCQTPVCLVCFKEKHVQHMFESIDAAFAKRKDVLSKQLREVNDVLITQSENKLKELRENYQKVVEKDDEIENEMKEQASILASQIQKNLDKNLHCVTRDRKANEVLFKKHEEDIVSQLRNLKGIKHCINNKLETKGGDNINTFWKDVEGGWEIHIQSDVISFSPASFSGGNIYPTLNAEQFGTYASTKFLRREGNVGGFKSSSIKQDSRATLIASFSSINSLVFYIDIASPTEIWVSGQNQNIVLLDIRGAKLKEIRTETDNRGPLGIAVMRDGSVIYCDAKQKCIKKVTKDGKHKNLIQTDWIPWGLFVTKSENILVSMTRNHVGKISRFDRNGKLRLTIGGEDNAEKKSLFLSPDDICESSNGDICVSDQGKKQVTVVDMTGQLNFTYKGDRTSDFVPFGICTDSTGNILVVNETDCSVHMLNQDGQFICFLLTAEDGIEDPNPIRVDSEGKLWLAERESGIIRVFKYQ